MTGTRDDFLSTVRSAADLLRERAVAAAWSRPSTLPEFSVGGLAGHLAYQILAIPQTLTGPAPQEQTMTEVGDSLDLLLGRRPPGWPPPARRRWRQTAPMGSEAARHHV
jgi:Mycothiol maleylpyruvate isomerase N-terminal domain